MSNSNMMMKPNDMMKAMTPMKMKASRLKAMMLKKKAKKS